jgi:hypothetical protein
VVTSVGAFRAPRTEPPLTESESVLLPLDDPQIRDRAL